MGRTGISVALLLSLLAGPGLTEAAGAAAAAGPPREHVATGSKQTLASNPAFVGAGIVLDAAGTGRAQAWRRAGTGWSETVRPAGQRVRVSPSTAGFTWTHGGPAGWLVMRTSDIAVAPHARGGGGTSAGAGGDVPSVATGRAADYRMKAPFVRDAQGRAVFFHGVNMVWKRKPYYPPSSLYGASPADSLLDERDARWLADNGFNSVRLGVLWAGVEPRFGVIDTEYLDRIDDIVTMFEQHGITVLLDFHQDMYNEKYQGEGFPDWALFDHGIRPTLLGGFPNNLLSPSVSAAFDDFWNNPAVVWREYARSWAATVRRLGHHRNIVGYDLINEPWPGTSAARCFAPGGCAWWETERLQVFQEYLARVIRLEDAGRGIVWWEPNVTASLSLTPSINIGARRPFDDAAGNQGISFHTYCLLGGGALPGLARGQDPTCPRKHRAAIDVAIHAGLRSGGGALLTEFGASEDMQDQRTVMDLADNRMVSWYMWQYGAWQDPTGHPAEQGFWADDRDRPNSLRRGKGQTLVRTYPQAVAGTPLGFGFHERRPDRMFLMSWRSDPAITAPTVVYVPVHQHYPGGYRVRVTGPGRVVSRAGSRYLVVENTGPGVVRLVLRRR